VEQICQAISDNGLTPEVYQIDKDVAVNSVIYAYVSAGIPVVVGCYSSDWRDGHAVTITGFRLESNIVSPEETEDIALDYRYVGRRISEFYAHDDNLGPFARFKTLHGAYEDDDGEPANPRRFERSWQLNGVEKCDELIPFVLIMPTYHKVRLRFETVQSTISEFDGYLELLLQQTYFSNDNSRIEWDIRLMELPRFKQELLSDATVPEQEKRSLAFKSYARYLWVSTAQVNGQKLLTLISDGTDMERSFSLNMCFAHKESIRNEIGQAIKEKDGDFARASDQSTFPSAFKGFLQCEFIDR
jgi:hypothetical protein